MKLFSILLLFGLVVAALLWMRTAPQAAPDVALNFTDGSRKMLADYQGKPVLVTFWSVNCPVCLKDVPELTKLHEGGLTVLAVSIPQDPPNVVLELLPSLAMPYPTVLDVHGEISHGFGGVQVTPTHFLLDPQGTVALHSRGAVDVVKIRATEATL